MNAMFEGRLFRWSNLCSQRGRWAVRSDDGKTTRLIRWWSPRDLIRFPLYWMWVRRYW